MTQTHLTSQPMIPDCTASTASTGTGAHKVTSTTATTSTATNAVVTSSSPVSAPADPSHKLETAKPVSSKSNQGGGTATVTSTTCNTRTTTTTTTTNAKAAPESTSTNPLTTKAATAASESTPELASTVPSPTVIRRGRKSSFSKTSNSRSSSLPKAMGRHERSRSFANLDAEDVSGLLSDIIRDNGVYLGGSSMGKGFKNAARYYLQNRHLKHEKPSHWNLPGAAMLTDHAYNVPVEESFYVLDLGVLVSQVYQWRRYFPRVEPFYAVKCNPDPLIVKTLATLGCNFDCASRNEIRLVHEASEDLPSKPEIIFANPCKPRAHLIEAVCKGVTKVTFDNAAEVQKCASISKDIQLILRIITDDRGSQCRLSTKFGAPRIKWRPLLAAAASHGLQVVGVSFHVGSGCRDAARYTAALNDAREIFDMAEKDFNMKMSILDIGGGFPGETHSIWNPASELDDEVAEGVNVGEEKQEPERYMFFTEIAEQVAPVIDELFPPSVRVIAEPGRYFVAACATLCCSVTSTRINILDTTIDDVEPIDDSEAAHTLDQMTRQEEEDLVNQHGRTLSTVDENADTILNTIQEELADYSKLFASQQLAQQEFDVYNDTLDLYTEGFESAADLLGPPEDYQLNRKHHTAEGCTYSLVNPSAAEDDPSSFLTLAAAGEAAVNGVVMQAVADAGPLQDDYAYYINDGVYGAFNNIMFDHATVRPRVLGSSENITAEEEDGMMTLQTPDRVKADAHVANRDTDLFASTVFGPTCDSIDVIARSVLLPQLNVGDWMYFNNMGAYTMAAASSFNGFVPSERFYVCSVQPEYFEALVEGPEMDFNEEKKSEN